MKKYSPLHVIHQLEVNPHWQFRFHAIFTVVWFFSMIGAMFIIPHQSSAEWVALVITEISLWANFATHFGAMSAALAAMLQTPEALKKPRVG